ncbi:Myeloid leukemia factor 2 [Halotydeus destructor]|nr:Myeloid leukemia factor 2 [Halotydeus destructor]
MALMNFGDFDDMFGRVDRMMNSVMRSMMGSMGADPYDMMGGMGMSMSPYGAPGSSVQSYSYSSNPHSYSHFSSSYTTYSSDGLGRPQVYEATSSEHRAPGGIKETTSTVRDSRTGLQQMSVGRHIYDRGHVMQKSRNHYTREVEETEEYVNIEDEEVPQFNEDWQRRTSRHRNHGRSAIEIHEVDDDDQPLAITDSVSPQILALPAPEPGPSHAGRSERSKKSRSKREKNPYKKKNHYV